MFCRLFVLAYLVRTMDINTEIIFLYGTHDSWHDPHQRFNVMVYTTYDDVGIVQLCSASKGEQYLSSMTALKTAIAERSDDLNDGLIDDIEWRRWLTHHWLPLTQAFYSEWTRARVPIDIRRSIDDVRANLGLWPVIWPTPLRLRTFADGSFSLVPPAKP